ncbi:MAG: histidine phosphatase family protein [Rubrivivax sp.]|nr:histidine phosphatase family protein [Rubrivivax sp.]
MPRRRDVLAAGLTLPLAPLPGQASEEASAERLIRAGGVVVAFRHALAPGTFDPPGLTLGDCRTQRNLDDEGRAQARRIGDWFRSRQLDPAAVRSSPWCRCVDTATLAFGRAEPWAALGSPRGSPETTHADHLQQLRRALRAAATRPGRFEVWVTHMFVLSDLAGQGTGSGMGLVLRAGPDDTVQVLARLAAA